MQRPGFILIKLAVHSELVFDVLPHWLSPLLPPYLHQFNVTLGLGPQSFLCMGSTWLTRMKGEDHCYLFKYKNRL